MIVKTRLNNPVKHITNGDELGFDFDMLGRLRGYDTDTRESTFNYDGTKRFGDFDGGWKRYHWCKSQFLGYENESNTFYVVLGAMGSVKVIFDHTQGIVNRLDYDRLGNLRNSDTSPQVELLFKKSYYNSESGLYIGNNYCPIKIKNGEDFRVFIVILVLKLNHSQLRS